MSNPLLKFVAALNYHDPVPILVRYHKLEGEVMQSDLPVKVRTLRTSSLKSAREGREAALFAHGLAGVVGIKVLVALAESADFDFVLRWEGEDSVHYLPVQLKELVSEERNPKASISDIVTRASQMPQSETALLIRVNRKVDIHIEELPLSGIQYRELWFLWQSSADGRRWSILGNALKLPVRYDFTYPGDPETTV